MRVDEVYAGGTGGGPSKPSSLTLEQQKVVQLLDFETGVQGIGSRRFGFQDDEEALSPESEQIPVAVNQSSPNVANVHIQANSKRPTSVRVDSTKVKKPRSTFGLIEEQGESRSLYQDSVVKGLNRQNDLLAALVAEFRRFNDSCGAPSPIKNSTPQKHFSPECSLFNGDSADLSIEVLDSDFSATSSGNFNID